MKYFKCEKCDGDKFCLFTSSDECTKPPITCLTEKNEEIRFGRIAQYKEIEDIEFHLLADSDKPFCIGPG